METRNSILTFVDPHEKTTPTPTPIDTNDMVRESTQPVHPTSHIRTYHRDLNKVMGSNNPRMMSEILQKAHHDEEVQQSKTLGNPKNKLLIIASFLFILLGIGSLLLVLYRTYATDLTIQTAQRMSLISAETNTNVTLTEGEVYKNRDRVRSALSTVIPLDSINNIFFTKQSLAGLVRLGFNDVVTITGGTIPLELRNTLDGNFMYGTYRSGSTFPFLIVRVQNYDDAFEGMHTWEPLMINQLGFLFGLPEIVQTSLAKGDFQSEIIANRTVRVSRYNTARITTLEGTTPTIVYEPGTLVLTPETTNLISEITDTQIIFSRRPGQFEFIEAGNTVIISATETIPQDIERTVAAVIDNDDGTLVLETIPEPPQEVEQEVPQTTTEEDLVPTIPTTPSEETIEEETLTNSIEPESIIPLEETVVPDTLPVSSEVSAVDQYQNNDIILMYTFLNEKTILITTSDAVLQEILIRLTNSQLLL